MISQDDLHYFIEVSRTLNFSRAAERIGISQPSLSIAMQRVEHDIGTQLFIRHKKGVHLTKSGNQLLLHAKQLTQHWELVKHSVRTAAHAVEGSFVIGSHPSLALNFFSGFLPALLKKYASLEIQIKLDLSRKIVEQIMELAIDLAVVANPIQHPNLIIQKLFQDEVGLWNTAKPHPVADLSSGKAILICDPELLQTQSLLRQLHTKGISYARILDVPNLEVILDLTADGCGVGILPATVALRQKKLQRVYEAIRYSDEICLVYRRENKELMAMKAMVTAIKSYFNSPQVRIP
jgi:DNA-binding transcriptional LysR family regulator